MKALIFIGLILMLLGGYIAIGEPNSFVVKTFVIEGNQENVETGYYNLQTFIVEEKPSGRGMLIETYKQTKDARKRNLLYEQRDEEIDKCIREITKNWKQTIVKYSYEKEYNDDKEEWGLTNEFWEREKEFYGYDRGQYLSLRWGLRNRALNGEEIC